MQASTARVALYWTPAADDPLCSAGNAWLGRDPELGVAVPQPDLPGLAEMTRAPALYGFHSTLRPPMRLATGWEDFVMAADQVAGRTAAFALPRLEVTVMDGCLALCLASPCPAFHSLADDCIKVTDRHRLRPEAAELERRRAHGLSPSQDALLLRWGYPYVMEHWRFHMTLTRRLTGTELAFIRPAAEQHFSRALSQSRRADDVAIFTQAMACDAPSPFLLGCRVKFRG